RPWLCQSNTWEGIFTEHVVEYFTYPEAIFVLKECLRTLIPGAWIRISLPDLKRFVEIYQGKGPAEEAAKYPHPVIAVFYLTQMHHHISTWDADLTIKILTEIGFADIREVRFREGADPRLCRDDNAK